jgi:hypothetical protein
VSSCTASPFAPIVKKAEIINFRFCEEALRDKDNARIHFRKKSSGCQVELDPPEMRTQ